MRLAELQKALRAADPAAVLVSPRILERIIQEKSQRRGLGWGVPHIKCYVVDRQSLFRHAEQADLDLEPDQLLPDTVILLARPPAEELGALERKIVLLKYWRRLFHACIHRALEAPASSSPGVEEPGSPGVKDNGQSGQTPRLPDSQTPRLTDELVRRRVEEIGRTEFEEIRTVLTQDRYLLPGAGDRETYVEFAATYLETRYFAAPTLTSFFPGLRDFQKIDQMLAQDVDGPALFARTRLLDAPDPVMPADTRSDETHEQYWALVRSAERADLAGNTVRASILRTRAWRIAPAALSQGTRAEAEADMRRLTTRLAAALQLSASEAAEWGKDLPLLLDKADQGDRPAEARLLEDLQKVCLDHERDIFTLDVVEWLLSAGKRPIKRPLPSLRLVRITRHLHSASTRLAAVRLSDVDREHLTRLVQAAVYRSEEALRARFGPILTTAMQDVGLRPTNPPERTAFAKMIEEILDRIISQGFLTFSDLRDTISRNQLKLPDLQDPEDFIRGDPLLRLDRRLASLLDGVYRPSEIYMRWLERLTALNFGTQTGRTITRWVTIPFGGAFLLLEGVELVLQHALPHHAAKVVAENVTAAGAAAGVTFRVFRATGPGAENVTAPGAAVAAGPAGAAVVAEPTTLAQAAAGAPVVEPAFQIPPSLFWLGVVLLGFFLMGLIHAPGFRRRCRQGVLAFFHVLRLGFVDFPVYLFRLTALRWVVTSWPFQLLYWYLLKPVAVCCLIGWWRPGIFRTPVGAGGVFLATAILLNSRLGSALGEGVLSILTSVTDQVRAGLLPGLYHLIVRLFKQVIDTVEWVLFTVDEWLRFRSGDTQLSLVVRTILGVLWFPVSYLARFYMVVLIEPGFNPIKAPVSYLAAKVMLPIAGPLTGSLAAPLEPLLGTVAAYAMTLPTVWLLPDAFGFLFWETKENWSLYRANRPRSLHAVPVGPHGETVKALLQPGFHSGTVPRLFTRLRQAERQAYRTRNWNAARACRHELEEIERALMRFVSRVLVGMLQQSPSWQGQRVSVGRVELAVNRIGVELVHADHLSRPVEIDFELRAGWLVAGVRDPGWLEEVTPEQRRAFSSALASLYKLAGVELVREQVQAHLPPSIPSYDITPQGLVVWPEAQGPPVLYNLEEADGLCRPHTSEGAVVVDLPSLDPQQVVFARCPLLWQQWLESWQKEREGQPHPGLCGRNGADLELLPHKQAEVRGQQSAGPLTSDS